MTQAKPSLDMRQFKVNVMIVPSVLEMQLTGATIRNEERIIEGYTLKDAKKRAGIQ